MPPLGPIKARGGTPNRSGYAARASAQQSGDKSINVFDSGVGSEGGAGGGSTLRTFSMGTFSQGTFSGLPAGGAGIAAVITVQIAVFDAGHGVDTAVQPSTPINVFDSGTGSDSSQLLVALSVSDAGQSGDFTTTVHPLSVSDSGVGTDTSDLRVQLTVFDAGVQTEVPIGLQNIPFALFDSGVLDDEQVTNVQIVGTDIGVGHDLVTGPIGIATSDAGTGSDIAVVTVPIRVSDSGVVVDSVSVNTGATKRTSDAGRVVEVAVISAVLVPRVDGARGADKSVLAVTHARSDTGVGVDTAAKPVVRTSANDAGVITDAAALQVVRSRTDSGHVVDTSAITYLQRNVFGHDSGVGHDSSSMAASISVQDEGTGHESRRVRLAGGYARDVVASTPPTWKSDVRDIVKDEGDDVR